MAKILIVDDRITNRELLLTLLGYAGHQLLEATDGEEGLAVTRAERPDLIITDIMMPKMDGYEFARQVRSDDLIKDTQIIFYTSSYIIAETLRLANACGVSIVIGKPIEPEIFLKKINEALSTKQIPVVAPASEEFHREHMRVLTDTLVNKVELLEAEILERKQMENILQASELRFRSLIEHGLDSISLLTPDGTLIWENTSAVRMLGYKQDEFVGKNIFQLVHPEDLERINLQFKELLDKPENIRRDSFRLKHENGTWRWVEAIGTNLLAEPSVNAIIINYRDVTERKYAEEHVQYQANLLQNVSDAIIASDITSSITSWNRAAEEIYGWSVEEAMGNSVLDLLQTEYENTTQDQVLKQFIEQGSWLGEVIQRRKDGTKIVVFASISLVRDHAGNPVAMVAVNRDITKSKQIEQALHDSEGQYKKLFEDLPISLWVEDFSEVKKYLDALKEDGVSDMPAYLQNHPDFIRECAKRVQVLDVNTAALNLYRANNKSDLLGSLSETSVTLSLDQIEYELIQLAKGQLNFEREGIDQTLTGEKVYVNMHWSVVPGYEHNLARVIVSAVDVTERKQAEKKIHHQLQRLNALRSIDLTISNTFDMKLSLRVLLNGAISQLGVDAASVLLFNRALTRLEYIAGEGFDTSTIQKTNLRIGEGHAGVAALERKAIYVKNLAEIDKKFIVNELFKEERFVSYYAVPLIAKGELKGILEIFNRSELTPDHEWVDFLEILAGQAAIAIDNAQLFQDMQRSNIELSLAYDATIEGWSAALDLRDKETEGHSQRVTDMAVNLAKRMGIAESELVQIRRGALLHDIGKLGIPDYILLKPDKLTQEEWQIMQKHPIYAHDMLSSISYLKSALDIPYCHHEKWDGTGYPRGLKNEGIPLVARIFAIVDVWDALTSDRPYRPAWTHERTLQHIKEQSGKHFDPQIVDAFVKMIDE